MKVASYVYKFTNGQMPLLAHVAPIPSITGSDVVIKTLTETTETLGLGKVVVELDAEKTIQIYVDHIEKKCKELGLS